MELAVAAVNAANPAGDAIVGALGAKGLGELPMDGPAPAIANAVAAATGAPAWKIPLTPEHVMQLIEGATDGRND